MVTAHIHNPSGDVTLTFSATGPTYREKDDTMIHPDPDELSSDETIVVDHTGSLIAVTHLDEVAKACGSAGNEKDGSRMESAGESDVNPPTKFTLKIPHEIHHDERFDDETLQKFFYSKIRWDPNDKLQVKADQYIQLNPAIAYFKRLVKIMLYTEVFTIANI